MWFLKFFILSTTALAILVEVHGYKSYKGYKVYKVIPETPVQLSIVYQFFHKANFDFWRANHNLGKESVIMVSPEEQFNFVEVLRQYNIKSTVTIEDVDRVIEHQYSSRGLPGTYGPVTFDTYMYYEEQMAYLRKVAKEHPNIAKLERIGQSVEGRDILLLRVSTGPSKTSKRKPVIFVDAGIHSREWAAPPVALYLIQQLVEHRNLTEEMTKNVDWAIVPNLNPDGYHYTQTSDRFWRKNRSRYRFTECMGTDLNRNFGFFWMYDGASSNPCDETFAGISAFSEPESRALRDWFYRNKGIVKLYLTFHSFGTWILYPWGFAKKWPENYKELFLAATLAGNAMAAASIVHTSYKDRINTSAIGLYPAAGGSDDWVKGVAGVELAYTIELPEVANNWEFALPARYIKAVVGETFEGIKAFHEYIDKFY